MQAHVYAIVLLFSPPCLSAFLVGSQVKAARTGKKVIDEERLMNPRFRSAIKGVPGVVALPATKGIPFAAVYPDIAASANPFDLKSPGRVQVQAPSDGFQVFTGLNDTLFASGGVGGGVDDSSYNHEVYPGAFQFLLELSRGPHESMNPSKVVPVSAHLIELTTEHEPATDDIVKDIALVGQTNGFSTWGLSLEQEKYPRSFFEFVLPHAGKELRDMHRTNFEADTVPEKPLSNKRGSTGFQERAEQLERMETVRNRKKEDGPDKPFVFVGDNGHGDRSQAERMVREANTRLAAAFIHDVQPEFSVLGKMPISGKVVLFDTYYDAAKQAFERGIISHAGLMRVEDAFASASIVQMCEVEDMFTGNRYPCFDTENKILIDAITHEPLPDWLTLDSDDGTARFPECSVGAMIPRFISPDLDHSRCDSISRVMYSMKKEHRVQDLEESFV